MWITIYLRVTSDKRNTLFSIIIVRVALLEYGQGLVEKQATAANGGDMIQSLSESTVHKAFRCLELFAEHHHYRNRIISLGQGHHLINIVIPIPFVLYIKEYIC